MSNKKSTPICNTCLRRNINRKHCYSCDSLFCNKCYKENSNRKCSSCYCQYCDDCFHNVYICPKIGCNYTKCIKCYKNPWLDRCYKHELYVDSLIFIIVNILFLNYWILPLILCLVFIIIPTINNFKMPFDICCSTYFMFVVFLLLHTFYQIFYFWNIPYLLI